MTTPLAIQWLRQVSGGIAARQLYPAEHPRVIDAVTRLVELTHQLIAGRPEVSLFVVEGRLICDGEVVQGADGIADRVFRQVHAHGYHRVTIRRGVTSSQVVRLISGLGAAAADPAAQEALQSTPHVVLSTLDGTPPSSGGELVEALAASRLDLRALWEPIEAQRAVDRKALDRILVPLVDVVNGAAENVLPLTALIGHDDYTSTHITNVALLTMALAQTAGMSGRAVRDVGIAALLHDIGKMKIPAEILSSATDLTPEQVVVIRRHPDIGARMLADTPGVPHLAVIVAYEHHLQEGGGGYPDVPRGWQVGLVSSMTHVADVYDALRTNRPYRQGLPHDVIVEMMMRDRGTVFSGPLLDIFFERIVPRTRVVEAEGSGVDRSPSVPAPDPYAMIDG